MLVFETLRSAFSALVAKRTRTLLTMLGIVVGVGSVIVMLAYGEGQKNELLKRFEGISDRSMMIEYNYSSRRDNLVVPRSFRFTEDDALAITRECSAIEFAIPENRGWRTEVSRESTTVSAGTSVAGPEIFQVYDAGVQFGRLYTEEENLNRKNLCVIGSGVKEKLFPEMPAVDQYLNVFGRRFKIVGVLRKAGNRWLDTVVFIPWYTGIDRAGIPWATNLRAQATSTSAIGRAESQVRELMHLRKPNLPIPDNIHDKEKTPIRIRTVASWKEEREATADSFALLLKVIGGLSLLIGGVGVMNIMLVSVHERTPEIGLRKAIGARRRDIMGQFLAESVMICLFGGGIGTFAAFLVCRFLERMPAEANIPDPVITSWAITVAVVVTLGTGLFFGVYPAVRAARLSPIEALHVG